MSDRQTAGEAPDDAAGSRAVLAHHGKSFNWAGRLLSKSALDRAARLYAFCRYLDDLADENPDKAEAEANLLAVREDLASGNSSRPDVQGFFDLCGNDPQAIAGALLMADTLRRDLQPVLIEDDMDLLGYALGVAGSVGIMMCPVLDVAERERALPFAIDLGLAMQMTNIARDVLEDAERDRCYLPASWMGARIDPGDVVADRNGARERLWPDILRLLDLADLYYDSARMGLCFLPAQARAAIHVASRVYRGIGSVIRRRGPDTYWTGRAFTTRSTKVWLTGGALAGLAALPGRVRARHDSDLHIPIADLLRGYGLPVSGERGTNGANT